MPAAADQQTLDVQSVGGLRLATFGNCVINSWWQPPSAVEFKALNDYTANLAERFPSGITMLVVLEPGCPFLDSAQRREMEDYYARFQPHLRGVAQVVEGGNLWSVTARSVMTAMRLVQKRPYPTKVFSDIEEGTEWLGAYVSAGSGQDMPATEAGNGLLRCVARLRQRR